MPCLGGSCVCGAQAASSKPRAGKEAAAKPPEPGIKVAPAAETTGKAGKYSWMQVGPEFGHACAVLCVDGCWPVHAPSHVCSASPASFSRCGADAEILGCRKVGTMQHEMNCKVKLMRVSCAGCKGCTQSGCSAVSSSSQGGRQSKAAATCAHPRHCAARSLPSSGLPGAPTPASLCWGTCHCTGLPAWQSAPCLVQEAAGKPHSAQCCRQLLPGPCCRPPAWLQRAGGSPCAMCWPPCGGSPTTAAATSCTG